MTPQRAAGDWVGLVFIVAAVIAQVINSLRRGKVERMPIPGTSLPRRFPQPAPARPVPAPAAPTPWASGEADIPASEVPSRLKDLFDTLHLPPEPAPAAPEPALPPEPTAAELYALAQREIAAEAATARPARPALAAHLGLGDLDAWRRAIIAREILDKPVALR